MIMKLVGTKFIVSRSFRDSRLLSIGAGADEIMLGIIAKYEGILPRMG